MVLKSRKAGFSLLEMTVVLVIITILSSTIVPQLIKDFTVQGARKLALDISSIQEASRAYYVANRQWPDSVETLKVNNYLPQGWNGLNPFANSTNNTADYKYTISTTSALLTVSTTMPIAAENVVAHLLPLVTVTGSILSSSVALPGSVAPAVPVGSIMAWYGRIATIPAGWALCDGSSLKRSDGNGFITVPDLRDRFIVGASQDNGGVAMTTVTGFPSVRGNGQLPAVTMSIGSFDNGFATSGAQGYVTGLSNDANDATVSFGSGPYNIAVYQALVFIMKI